MLRPVMSHIGRESRFDQQWPRFHGESVAVDAVRGDVLRATELTGAWLTSLARISHHLTVEARHRPAITALRLLAVLNVGFKYARIIQQMRRRAARALY